MERHIQGRGWCRYARAMAALMLLAGAQPALAQKTDTVAIIRGSHVIGEIKGLQNGKLQLSTWAMSTVYIEWPKVSTVSSPNKRFEIDLADGRRFFGSLQASEAPNQVAVIAGADTLTVSTQDVVTLFRLKPNFWDALDGNINVGADFTQQNAKTDLSLSATVRYKTGLHNFRLTTFNSFSRQDGADDIASSYSDFSYAKEFGNRWLWGGVLATERNSQLDLEFRATLGGGVGRFLIQTNKVNLGLLGGLAYARENYTGEAADGTVPAFVTAEFLYFLWGALKRELSGQLTVLPVLGSNRWRVQFTSSVTWEIVHRLNLGFQINNDFDSNPPSEGAENNAFSVTTSVGFSF